MQRMIGKKQVDAATVAKRMQHVLDAYEENKSQLFPMASTSSIVSGYVSYSTECGLEGHTDILNYAAKKCEMESASSNEKPTTKELQDDMLSRLRPKRAIKRYSETKSLTNTRKQRKWNKRIKKDKVLIEAGTKNGPENDVSTNNDDEKVKNVAKVLSSDNFNE